MVRIISGNFRVLSPRQKYALFELTTVIHYCRSRVTGKCERQASESTDTPYLRDVDYFRDQGAMCRHRQRQVQCITTLFIHIQHLAFSSRSPQQETQDLCELRPKVYSRNTSCDSNNREVGTRQKHVCHMQGHWECQQL